MTSRCSPLIVLQLAAALTGCSSSDPGPLDLGARLDQPLQDIAMAKDTAPPPEARAEDLAGLDLPGADAATTASPYDHDGKQTVTSFNLTVTIGLRSFIETVYLPGAPGPHAVVLLRPGLLQPAAAYTTYGRRLASHGIVTLIRDDPGALTSTTVVVADLTHVVKTVLPAENAQAGGKLAGRLDLTRVALAGHSRGGKATLVAAAQGLQGKLKGWVGIDPVDSIVLGGVMARDVIGGIGVPTLFLGASVSSTCSPAADNYKLLHAAAPAPSVAFTFVGAGHTQFEDQAHCVLCAACAPAGTAAQPTVLSRSARYLMAFFARELLGDATVGSTLDGAGAAADIAAGLITRTAK